MEAAACQPSILTQPVNQLRNLALFFGARRATQWYCPPETGYIEAISAMLDRSKLHHTCQVVVRDARCTSRKRADKGDRKPRDHCWTPTVHERSDKEPEVAVKNRFLGPPDGIAKLLRDSRFPSTHHCCGKRYQGQQAKSPLRYTSVALGREQGQRYMVHTFSCWLTPSLCSLASSDLWA